MRAAVAVVAAVLCLLAAPALGHERATARLDSPAAGEVVTGDTVEVVVTAVGTGTPAEFRLLLDGAPVDETGAVGGSALFTTLRLQPGQTKRIVVRLPAPGQHTLRLEPTPHADRPEAPTVRTFTSRLPATPAPSAPPGDGGDGGLPLAPLALAGAAVLAAAGGVVAYRRR